MASACSWQLINGCAGTIASCGDFDLESSCFDAGCTWERAACAGVATPCSELPLQECSSQPGCDVVTAEPQCTGDPVACAARSGDTCLPETGCGQGVCTSRSNPEMNVPCSYVDSDETCDRAVGCTRQNNTGLSTCEGTALCSQQVYGTPCVQMSCDWAPGCNGFATPCEALPLAFCEQAGCTLEG